MADLSSSLPVTPACGGSWIGPVEVDWLEPDFSRNSSAEAAAANRLRIVGECSWNAAEHLREYVGNIHFTDTLHGQTGVPARVWTGPDAVADLRGDYLLLSMDTSASRLRITAGREGSVPFSIEAMGMGQLRVDIDVQTFTSASDFPTIAGRGVLADPFYNENADGTAPFLLEPWGTNRPRPYDHETMRGLGPKSTPLAGTPPLPPARKIAVVVFS